MGNGHGFNHKTLQNSLYYIERYIVNFQVGHDFVKFMEKYATDGLDVETKDIMTKYGLEVIASAGFGIEAKAFNDPDGIFSDRVAR